MSLRYDLKAFALLVPILIQTSDGLDFCSKLAIYNMFTVYIYRWESLSDGHPCPKNLYKMQYFNKVQ